MTSPSNPGQKESKEVFHDGMSDKCHEEQFEHANRGTEKVSSEKEEENENVEKEEKSEKKEEEEED